MFLRFRQWPVKISKLKGGREAAFEASQIRAPAYIILSTIR